MSLIIAVPEVGLSKVDIILIVVVLPAPLGPKKPNYLSFCYIKTYIINSNEYFFSLLRRKNHFFSLFRILFLDYLLQLHN